MSLDTELLSQLDDAGISLTTAADILAMSPKAIPHIWGQYIPRRCVTLVTGEGGIGKSLTLQALSLAVATGRDFLDLPITKGPVLYVDLENDTEVDILPRITKLANGIGIAAEDTKQLYVVQSSRSFKLDDRATYNHLRDMVRALKPVMLVVDPLVCTLSGDEDNAVYMRSVFDTLTSLAKEYDMAVVVSHHPRKRGMQNDPGQMIRGSSDIRNAVSSHMAIVDVRGVLTILHDKCRSTIRHEPLSYSIDANDDAQEITFSVAVPGKRRNSADKAVQRLRDTLTYDFVPSSEYMGKGKLSKTVAYDAYGVLVDSGVADGSTRGYWRLLPIEITEEEKN